MPASSWSPAQKAEEAAFNSAALHVAALLWLPPAFSCPPFAAFSETSPFFSPL